MKKVQQQTKQQEPLLLRELEQAHKCGDAFVTASGSMSTAGLRIRP